MIQSRTSHRINWLYTMCSGCVKSSSSEAWLRGRKNPPPLEAPIGPPKPRGWLCVTPKVFWTCVPGQWLLTFRSNGSKSDIIGYRNPCKSELCFGRFHGTNGKFACTHHYREFRQTRMSTGTLRFTVGSNYWNRVVYGTSYKLVSQNQMGTKIISFFNYQIKPAYPAKTPFQSLKLLPHF